MYKLSQLIGREIINIDNAKSYGKLTDLAIIKAPSTNIITDTNAIIPCDKVTVGEAIITSCIPQFNIGAIQKLTKIGGYCLDTCGKKLGNILDYELNNNLTLRRIITDKMNFSTTKLQSLSDEIIIINRKKVSVPKPIPISDISKEKNITIPNDPSPNITIINDYSFLLNRRVIRDIHAKDGTRIICGNSIVNTEIITKARLYNKLVELSLYTEILNNTSIK